MTKHPFHAKLNDWRHDSSPVKRSLNRLWRLGRNELVTLVLIAFIAGGVWVFISVADEVFEGDTETIDQQIILALRNPDDLSDPIGPRWFEEMCRDFTSLGGTGILVLVTAAGVGYLLLVRKTHAMVLLLIAVGGGQGLSSLMKLLFDRARPDLVPHGSFVYSASFPSGHSLMSAVTYLTLGALLARVQPSRRLKAYLLGIAVTLTIIVGCSRVYLGVHWPTDVLAGWSAGATWALLCWLVAMWLQRHGQVEQDTPEPRLEPTTDEEIDAAAATS